MLRTHAQAGAKSVGAYAARTMEVCLKSYRNFATDTLSFSVDQFITRLVDSTTHNYVLQDCACRTLTWQHIVQMAQACEDSRVSMHASPVVAAVTNKKVGAASLDKSKRASTNNIVAPVWQQCARDERVKGATHSSKTFYFENSRVYANKSKGRSTAKQNCLTSTKRSLPPYFKSTSDDNSLGAAENSATQNSIGHRVVTCFKCGKSCNIASASQAT